MNPFDKVLNDLKRENNLRGLPPDLSSRSDFYDFSSNDYMGLSESWKDYLPELREAFPDAGFSSSASRLLSIHQDLFKRLEDNLGNLYNREALVFNSGYHVNTGVISALSSLPSTLILADKLIHASVIDGLMLGKSQFKRFPHNDISSLNKIIEKEKGEFSNIIIAVESVYSMEGDCSSLKELVELKNRLNTNEDGFRIFLYVDEAHAFGVRGARGLGLSEEEGIIDDIDFIVATFGKAAASTGAFVACSASAKEFFINKSRSFIFSTALPPVNIAWNILMVKHLQGMAEERRILNSFASKFKRQIEQLTGFPNPSASQIVPLVTGDSSKALVLSHLLAQNGIIAKAIRRPTIPPGRECVRFSLRFSPLMKEDFEGYFNSVFKRISDSWLNLMKG